MRFHLLLAFAALTLGSLLAWNAKGGDGCGCCPHCGGSNFTKSCRLIPEVTKVPQVEYSCKCGEICVPGRSICCGKECVTDCDGHIHHQKVFMPTCGKIFATVTPAKTTTMIEKCTYKCVVETVCCNCGAPAGGPVPQGPLAAPASPEDRSHWHRSN